MSLLRTFVVPTALALTVVPLATSAQTPQSAAETRPATEPAVARARAALAPIAAIVGQWEGDARISQGPGATMTVRQSEDITWGAGGTVLMIKGTGRSVAAENAGEIVFEAAAIAWFDAESGKVRMQSHNNGRSLVIDAEVRPDTLIWGFPAGGGHIRYTIAVSDDTFHEIGEFLRPGAPAVKTLEMTLKRK